MTIYELYITSLVAQMVKRLPTMQETRVQSLGGRSPGEGNGDPLQYSCLKNTMDRGAWRAVVHVCKRVGHDLATEQQQTGGQGLAEPSPPPIPPSLCCAVSLYPISGPPGSPNINCFRSLIILSCRNTV